MPILKILTYPDSFLEHIAEPVKNIDENILSIINSMTETMYKFEGVGLAATQVGIDNRILIYDYAQTKSDEKELIALINPEIISTEGSFVSENEGCLSVPNYRSNVKRAAYVKVRATDENGGEINIEAEGLLSVILQHEIDHLNGKLFINRISALKRQIYIKKEKKNKKK
jgi:peptide deformylase